jgi:DNA-binding transcriptional LysR family regulator
MRRTDLGDLAAFLAVAEHRSFTRAAAKLGTSQSSLSLTVRRLEARLGVRLLSRTTRTVAPTEAGERLLETLRPALHQIDDSLSVLSHARNKLAGTIRITTSEHVAKTIIWPKLERLLAKHPDIHVELNLNQAFTDIVKDQFDAGVRLGERVAKDMIAVRISPDLRMALVGAPAYFAAHGTPKTPHELPQHNCINLRFPTLGGLYAWEFEKRGRPVNVRVQGQLIFNDISLSLRAAAVGFGLAFVMEDQAKPYLSDKRLVRALEDWCPPFPGYHLYYPSRRQISPAFALVVEALRYRGKP